MTSLWLAAGFVSCLDEPLMDDEEIGEGTAMVSFDITSVPQTDAELGKSRAEGEAIGSINNVLWRFIRLTANWPTGSISTALRLNR